MIDAAGGEALGSSRFSLFHALVVISSGLQGSPWHLIKKNSMISSLCLSVSPQCGRLLRKSLQTSKNGSSWERQSPDWRFRRPPVGRLAIPALFLMKIVVGWVEWSNDRSTHRLSGMKMGCAWKAQPILLQEFHILVVPATQAWGTA